MAGPWEEYKSKPWEDYKDGWQTLPGPLGKATKPPVSRIGPDDQPSKTTTSFIERLAGIIAGAPAGVAETGMALGSSAIATPIAGFAGLGTMAGRAAGLTQADPADIVRQTQQRLTYQPQTQVGRSLTGGAAGVLGLIPKAGEAIGGGVLGVTGSPMAATAADVATQMAIPYALGKAAPAIRAKSVEAARQFEKERALEEPRRKTSEELVKKGYAVQPTALSKDPVTNALETWAGAARTAQKGSLKNQAVTNSLIRRVLGLGEKEPVTTQALEKVRQNAYIPYEAIEKSGIPIKSDKSFNDARIKLGGDFGEMGKRFPEILKKSDDVKALIGDLAKREFTAPEAMMLIKQLRKNSSLNLQGKYDPGQWSLGFAQREAANLLEDLIDRNLSKSKDPSLKELVPEFKKARQLIAQSHDIEAALNEYTGNVDARYFGALSKKGLPLSGELETVAKLARTYPQYARTPEALGGVSAASPWEVVGAEAALAAGHPEGLAVALARGFPKSLILSRRFQRGLVTPPQRPRGLSTAAAIAESPYKYLAPGVIPPKPEQ